MKPGHSVVFLPFLVRYQLTHPPADSGVTYNYPRLESPTNSLSPVTVLQQYDDNGVQRLLFFAVPVGI